MPSFKRKLSEEERWQLVDYIRTFSQARELRRLPLLRHRAPAKAAAAN